MDYTENSTNCEMLISDTSSHSVLESGHFPKEVMAISRQILAEVMKFRRTLETEISCSPACLKCSEPHILKVASSVEKGLPIQFVLPAFPGKSPNLSKVLGPLPDMAEMCALEFLQYLCDRIGILYKSGAEIILCSDGRVFSDAVGMLDSDITTYQLELSKMIKDLGLKSISTFNLEEEYSGLSFDEMRLKLMEEYGQPLVDLTDSVRRGKVHDSSPEDRESHRLYCGITRFLFEDSVFPGQEKSRTSIQKDARVRAYKVIQKSKAWGDFIENRFPSAIRLSIHPQSCGDKKLGIRLIEPDNWQTPWHGVAVLVEGKFILLKRAHAEAMGAQLVHRSGKPSHFILDRTLDNGKLEHNGLDYGLLTVEL